MPESGRTCPVSTEYGRAVRAADQRIGDEVIQATCLAECVGAVGSRTPALGHTETAAHGAVPAVHFAAVLVRLRVICLHSGVCRVRIVMYHALAVMRRGCRYSGLQGHQQHQQHPDQPVAGQLAYRNRCVRVLHGIASVLGRKSGSHTATFPDFVNIQRRPAKVALSSRHPPPRALNRVDTALRRSCLAPASCSSASNRERSTSSSSRKLIRPSS